MTTVTIELPDEQAALLRTRAISQGLTLEGWFQKTAERESPVDPAERAKAAVDRILEIQGRSKPDPDGWTIRDYIDYGRP
jgi:hypothetical protein